MTTCPGDGSCLLQCQCECYDEEKDEYLESCVCGHREHKDNYCPSSSQCGCLPMECRNFQYCGEKLPQWVLNCNNGMSMNCAIQMGLHSFPHDVDTCSVCLESKPMLLLKCNHTICNDCWLHITRFNKPSSCPQCRQIIAWGPQHNTVIPEEEVTTHVM